MTGGDAVTGRPAGGDADSAGAGSSADAVGVGNAAGSASARSSADAAGVVTVLMTAPDARVAEKIVRRLLDEGLVACGNVLPGATSLYRWEGKVQRDEEVVVVMKSVQAAAARVVERAEELHPYDVPEILVHQVVGGGAAYLAWVRAECGSAPDGERVR